ncbi:MAG: enoyl-[acyl-carrier-protein] reductase [NADH] [Planctomycetaceae bacterium]|nr:MAG: enoyl-[acyl-carrier-protein] reductase [NADH] [Planctomycetaceae bacterium]
MGLLQGKKGLIFGVANDHSIAWAIAEQVAREGAELGFTHLPDKDPANPKMERRVRKLVEPLGPKFLVPCNVQSDDDLDRTFQTAREAFGQLDFVVHSIAYAAMEDLKGPVHAVSRDGFKLAMEISVYSLLAIVHRAADLMPQGGSVLTLTYLGGERVIPGYNIMGLCKAALENAVKYLAYELGPQHVRVNAISAGPLRTLSSSAVKGIDQMLSAYEMMAPLKRNIEGLEVGRAALFLLSELASGITGENLHVDSGFHIMGAPPSEARMAVGS